MSFLAGVWIISSLYSHINIHAHNHVNTHLSWIAFKEVGTHAHPFPTPSPTRFSGLVAWADQQRLLLNIERKGQKSCLVFLGLWGNSSQQIVFRQASRQGRPVVEIMQKEARRGWGQGYPVRRCLSAPSLSPLITPSPLSPQQSPWETNLSSLREGWRWGRGGLLYASAMPFSL